jgi:hypothetical protein
MQRTQADFQVDGNLVIYIYSPGGNVLWAASNDVDSRILGMSMKGKGTFSLPDVVLMYITIKLL